MKKRHHFVPQFYLRRFTIMPDDLIWTYDLERDEVRGSAVSATAFERYLYSVEMPNGERLDDLEDFIATIEGKAAPLFEKIIRGDSIAGQDRADMASFLALMYVRTDAFRRHYAEAAMGMMQLQFWATAQHDGAFRSMLRKYEAAIKPLSAEEREALRDGMLNPQKFTVSVDKGWTLQALKFLDHLAPIISKMRWMLLRVGSPHFLITSDNPLVMRLPERHRHPMFGGGGFLHKNIEVTLPLSPHHCLMLHWNPDLPAVSPMPLEAIRGMNRQRAAHAERFLFAHVRDERIRRLGAKYKDFKTGFTIGGGPKEYSPVELRRR
jgi:hypothetical protein